MFRKTLSLSFVICVGLMSQAFSQSNTEVNGDLTDECLVSFVQLEEAFIEDNKQDGFNPFSSNESIARMRMLIDMVAMCSENGLLPGTEKLTDLIKKKVL